MPCHAWRKTAAPHEGIAECDLQLYCHVSTARMPLTDIWAGSMLRVEEPERQVAGSTGATALKQQIRRLAPAFLCTHEQS